MFFYADTEDELLDTLDEILAHLESVGWFAAAHKCTFFSREIVWCGQVYSQWRVSHDPVRLQGLSDMRRPETAAELMKFLQAISGTRYFFILSEWRLTLFDHETTHTRWTVKLPISRAGSLGHIKQNMK